MVSSILRFIIIPLLVPENSTERALGRGVILCRLGKALHHITLGIGRCAVASLPGPGHEIPAVCNPISNVKR